MNTTFRKVMQNEGIRVQELAEAAGVSTKTVSKLRNHKPHGVEDTTLNRIIKAFNAMTEGAYKREELEL